MKINEIDDNHNLDEGPIWQGLKGLATGGISGARAGYAQGQGQQKIAPIVKQQIDRWNQSIGMNPAANTPENLQNFANKISGGRLPQLPPVPNVKDAASVRKYINDVVSQDLAAHEMGADTQPVAREPFRVPENPNITITAGISNPEANPTLKYGRDPYVLNDETGQWENTTGTPAAAQLQKEFFQHMGKYAERNTKLNAGFDAAAAAANDQPQADQQPVAQLAPGVSITNDEPIQIKVKNNEYMLNDSGVWAPWNQPNKPVSQAMQAYLNKQHEIYLNQNPDTVTPVEPAQTAQVYPNTSNVTPAVPPGTDVSQTPPTTADALAQRQPPPTTADTPAQTQPPAVVRRRGDTNFDPTLSQAPTAPEAPAPSTTTPNFGTGVGPGVKPQMTVTPTMANNASLPSGEYGWSNPTNPNYVGRREVARRKSANLPQTNDRGQVEPAMYEESIDLGEVLWRKMKSRRR